MRTKDNQKYYIYCITNLNNNKLYIGQTNDFNRRCGEHKSCARSILYRTYAKNCMPISRAMARHGIDNFKFDIIEEHTSKYDLDCAEDFWIEFFQSRKKAFGYNILKGGNSGNKGHKLSESTIHKIKLGIKSRSEEYKKLIAKRISDTQRGRHNSPQTEFKKGHKLSEESIKKISNSLKGKPSWNKGTKGIMHPTYSFPKGHMPWNFNKFGIMKANKASFKPGHVSWAKGTKDLTRNGSKITGDDAKRIVDMFHNQCKNKNELAKLYNIKERAIRDIVYGRTFDNITNVKGKYTKKSSLLTADKVIEILNCYKEFGVSVASEKFNVQKRVVNYISSGFCFSEITGIQYTGKSKRKIKIDKIGTYDI
jgi:group I intron endonuclease